MRAVQLTAYGDPLEGLKYVDIPEPEAPAQNQCPFAGNFCDSERCLSFDKELPVQAKSGSCVYGRLSHSAARTAAGMGR
jgi:hypothetical protein